MPNPLSDDLRCRILQAYLRGEGLPAELSRRFGVSFEYVRKIRRRCGQAAEWSASRSAGTVA